MKDEKINAIDLKLDEYLKGGIPAGQFAFLYASNELEDMEFSKVKNDKVDLDSLILKRDSLYLSIQKYIKKANDYKDLKHSSLFDYRKFKKDYIQLVHTYIKIEDDIYNIKQQLNLRTISRYCKIVDIDNFQYISADDFMKLYGELK